MTRQHSKGDAVARSSDLQGALAASAAFPAARQGRLESTAAHVVYVSQEQNLPRIHAQESPGATSWKGPKCVPSFILNSFQLKGALGRRWLGEDGDVCLHSAP